jgi:serine O-acetyltransferase
MIFRRIYNVLLRPVLHGVKKFKNFLRDLLVCIWRGWNIRLLTACDMNVSKIPATTEFRHPVGIVISSQVKIGHHCSIRQNVTIGLRDEKEKKYPVLGNHVQIGAGAMILGHVSIGDHAIIGAGAIVLKDVPPRSIYRCQLEPIIKPLETD